MLLVLTTGYSFVGVLSLSKNFLHGVVLTYLVSGIIAASIFSPPY